MEKDSCSIDFNGNHVRVVKEIDLKSIGLCPRRFESCRYRYYLDSAINIFDDVFIILLYIKII